MPPDKTKVLENLRQLRLRVVLVRSIYETNVGASSRALANMGVEDLILIAPQCDLTFKAQQAAATGQGPLQNRKVYANWDEFHKTEPDGIRISLTARDGRGREVKDLQDTLQKIAQDHRRFRLASEESLPVYLIFGPEDWGLSHEDLELTHFCCSIPTFGDNSSLNLAQAVLLALFITRSVWGGERTVLDGQIRQRPEAPQNIFPAETLKTWLLEMGFNLDKPKMNVYSVLKRMILHNVPTSKELFILETVLQQSIRKLKDYNRLREKE